MTADQVRAKLLRITSTPGNTQRGLAQRMGCSPTLLNDIILGKREPSGPVIEWLGLERQVRYVAQRAGTERAK